MLGHIRGKVLAWDAPELLLDVGGMGFDIRVATADWDVPELGSEQTLHTHLVIRDDAWVLYGFASQQHRLMFRLLIKMSKIGPATALGMMCHMSLAEMCTALRNSDIARLTSVPGIGKRSAERLVIEMKDKLAHFEDSATTPVAYQHAVRDACSALESLGYGVREAQRAVAEVSAEGGSSEELVQRVLQRAGGH